MFDLFTTHSRISSQMPDMCDYLDKYLIAYNAHVKDPFIVKWGKRISVHNKREYCLKRRHI